MSITRWDPWGDMVGLRDAMNDLLAQSYVRPGTGGLAWPGVDVAERDDAYVVSVEAPGIDPDDVTVSVLGNTLRISGQRRERRQQGSSSDRQDSRNQGKDQNRDQQQRGGQRQDASARDQQGNGQGSQRWLVREQRYGAFERTVTLPTGVDAGAAEAEFDHGILTITLPKAEEARERRIQVRAGKQQQPEDVEVKTAPSGGDQHRQGSHAEAQ